MALYAFDGTWQEDEADPSGDTNVVRFRDAYADGAVFYAAGVGTRWGWLGRFLGALTGAGGRKRVQEALAAFRTNQLAGDRNVDVIGFSRGAALALHFANSLPPGTSIRFLGLFDTVPSFGVPGNRIDLGWKLCFPIHAEHCCHAMAVHESRYNFPLHRLEANARLEEVWFKGVHSDVGGGNGNEGLSSIPLDWMFAAAHRRGVRLDRARVVENRACMRPVSPVSLQRVRSQLRRRTPQPGDRVHPSVQARG